MAVELLRASEAARRLDVPTKALLELVRQRRIRYEMVDGIAHIPADALVEYQAQVTEASRSSVPRATDGRVPPTGTAGRVEWASEDGHNPAALRRLLVRWPDLDSGEAQEVSDRGVLDDPPPANLHGATFTTVHHREPLSVDLHREPHNCFIET